MFFLGYTRFSLFQTNSSSWRASNNSRFQSEQEYKDYLFSKERLDLRLDIFINESLPIIAEASKNYSICHVVAYSDDLPEFYENHLIKASEKYKFLKLNKHKNGKESFNIFDIPKNSLEVIKDGVFGYYRLDDDDLLSVDYFDQVSKYVTKNHIGFIVSLGTGATAIRSNGKYYNVRKGYYPMFSAGLLSICGVSTEGKLTLPVSISHSDSDKANPVILDSRNIGYFWVRHPGQDTSLDYGLPDDEHVFNIVKNSMSKYPKLDEESIKNLFPSIIHKFAMKDSPYSNSSQIFKGYHTLDKNLFLIKMPHNISSSFELSFKYKLDTQQELNNGALISFNILENNEKIIASSFEEELKKIGIFYSKNPKIGFYKYLPVHKGNISVDYSFSLPKSLSIQSISIMKWGSYDGNVILEEVFLSQK